MSNEHKSAILASIADAETYARREFEYGFEETSERVAKTATAARAEHAEMVEALRDAYGGWRYIRVNHGDLYGVGWERVEEKLKSLLSRVGGGS